LDLEKRENKLKKKYLEIKETNSDLKKLQEKVKEDVISSLKDVNGILNKHYEDQLKLEELYKLELDKKIIEIDRSLKKLKDDCEFFNSKLKNFERNLNDSVVNYIEETIKVMFKQEVEKLEEIITEKIKTKLKKAMTQNNSARNEIEKTRLEFLKKEKDFDREKKDF